MIGNLNKGWFFLVLFACFQLGCNNQEKTSAEIDVNAIIPIVDYELLEPFLTTDSEKIHIVNFWAMWCEPCVKELPFIDAYSKKNPDTEVVLVSLDFPEDVETKLKPFLKKNNIRSRVLLLDDPDANSWIDKIDPSWSGAIPFTIIFNKDSRYYQEGEFESIEDLEEKIRNTFNT